jgi:phosphoserine phosphatase
MSWILSLVAPEGRLDRARLASLVHVGGLGAPDWLAPAEACDLPIAPDADPRATLAAARAALAGQDVDVNLVELAKRRKRLLVADMESTLIRNEMLDELAEMMGIGPQVAAVTARAMNGEIDFKQSLRARVGLLAGRPAALLDAAAGRIVAMPGAATLIATMRGSGAFTAIVSGGFTVFSRRVREGLAADHDEATEILIDGKLLAGAVREPILDAAGKAEALRRLARTHGLGLDEAIATGDGANDLDMLGLAGFGVAFRAKPRVAAAARMSVAHGDLTALLFLQGYRRSEFAEPAPASAVFTRP